MGLGGACRKSCRDSVVILVAILSRYSTDLFHNNSSHLEAEQVASGSGSAVRLRQTTIDQPLKIALQTAPIDAGTELFLIFNPHLASLEQTFDGQRLTQVQAMFVHEDVHTRVVIRRSPASRRAIAELNDEASQYDQHQPEPRRIRNGVAEQDATGQNAGKSEHAHVRA